MRDKPPWWPEFEQAFWDYRDRVQPSLTETLHRLTREGRSPLFVIVARDRRGHVVHASACDPDDYC